jgi:hypothetical protein
MASAFDALDVTVAASAEELRASALHEEMRYHAAWGGCFLYCVACGKWSDDAHRASAKHVKRCGGPAPQQSPHQSSLEASQRLAEVLGAHNEIGFEMYGALPTIIKPLSDPVAALRRLCIIQNQPRELRKMASHCGGITPNDAYGVHAFKDTPGVADAGNAIYAAFVDRLLDYGNEAAADVDSWKIEQLKGLNAEHKGDLVEAALAAANAAAAKERGLEWTWVSLQGGACGVADDVTRFIERAVCWQCMQA